MNQNMSVYSLQIASQFTQLVGLQMLTLGEKLLPPRELLITALTKARHDTLATALTEVKPP